MKELRIYTNPAGAGAVAGVFYSRRADGPYYRWHYEEDVGQWRVSRVRLSNLTLRVLNPANWQTVPTALQAVLNAHYLG